MNILNKFTLKSLLKNKTRTVVTVIGIILSASMICAVTTFISSIYAYALSNAVYNNGDWHGSALDTTFNTYEDIVRSGKTKKQVYACQLGYSIAEGCENENKPYIYVLGASDGFDQMMPINITEGRYPKSPTEILLPEHLADNGGVKFAIGTSITLGLGYRESDGFKLGQNTPYYTYDANGNEVPLGEDFSVRESRTYTVVGFYARPSFEPHTAPGYTAITIIDSSPDQHLLYSIWFKMNRARDVYSFMEEMGISGGTNWSVLTYSGAFRYDSINSMITGLAAIIIALIMFGSVSLIYNAFSISVSERTKQFGLLSSLGATRKQLKKAVIFEAAAVSLVGIPIGIGVGILGIGITLLFIGSKFETLIDYPIPLRLSVSPLSIVVAIAVSIVTVLISAYVPSKRATKISAVEAIRLNRDISAKRSLKTSRLTYRIFGLSGVLASKHYKRSKKKYRSTVISLFMSIVLFVSASSFTDYLNQSVSGSYQGSYFDIYYINNNDTYSSVVRDTLLTRFKNDTAVTDVTYLQSRSLFANINKSYLSDGFEAKDFFETITDDTGKELGSIHVNLYFIDDASFDALLRKNNLKSADFKNADSPKGVVLDTNTYFDYEKEKYVTANLLKGKECIVDVSFFSEIDGYYYYGVVPDDNGVPMYRYMSKDDGEEYIDLSPKEAYTSVTLTSGKVIDERPFYIDSTRGLVFIYPDSLKNIVLKNTTASEYSYKYYFTSANHTESYKAIEKTLEESGIKGGSLINYAQNMEEERNIVIIIQVFSYGFIVLISLIAAANVFNTISTNINLRRREFAMLKSVGMTDSGFNRMMIYECLLYGSRSLIYGLPFSVLITYLIYLVVNEGYAADFRLPMTSISISVLSVFTVVFASMMYAMHKIKKDNTIDALKNENI